MKKYTHAWLAMMAIKRLHYADIPDKNKEDAQALVRWFKNYRDFVIQGAWYPDEVYKDMATSHVIKYRPNEMSTDKSFRKMPNTHQMYQLCEDSELRETAFTIESGNLADRCESLAHGIVDCFKMLRLEDKGSPISPSNNHIATRFFILSHYIADAHMPLHCDARSFSSGDNIHGFIESQWDNQVKKSYKIDYDNERFYYDPEGYPLQDKTSELINAVEQGILSRPFYYGWGTGNNNTWDYMSGVSQYSYLMAYKMIPKGYDETNLNKDTLKSLESWSMFDAYSEAIFLDAIDSIARIWLHAWTRYRNWANKKED